MCYGAIMGSYLEQIQPRAGIPTQGDSLLAVVDDDALVQVTDTLGINV